MVYQIQTASTPVCCSKKSARPSNPARPSDSGRTRNLDVAKPLANSPVPRFQLFDLTQDPGETTDLTARHPEIADRLQAQLETLIKAGRSRK